MCRLKCGLSAEQVALPKVCRQLCLGESKDCGVFSPSKVFISLWSLVCVLKKGVSYQAWYISLSIMGQHIRAPWLCHRLLPGEKAGVPGLQQVSLGLRLSLETRMCNTANVTASASMSQLCMRALCKATKHGITDLTTPPPHHSLYLCPSTATVLALFLSLSPFPCLSDQ